MVRAGGIAGCGITRCGVACCSIGRRAHFRQGFGKYISTQANLYDRVFCATHGVKPPKLAGLAAVDWVVPFGDDTPAALIEQLQPDVLVKGGDWQVDQIAGELAERVKTLMDERKSLQNEYLNI